MKFPRIHITINAGSIVFVTLAWSYLWRPVLLPFVVSPLAHVALLASLVLLGTRLFRDCEWRFELEGQDIFIFVSYILLFGFLNIDMLRESLAGDELGHAERAVDYLNTIAVCTGRCPFWGTLRDVPVNLLNQYVSLVILTALVLAVMCYRRFLKPASAALSYGVGFLFCVLLGLGAHALNFPVEPHPPLRLLPLFLGQLIFGLTDFSFRIPSLVAAAVVAWCVQKRIRAQFPDANVLAWAIGLVIYLIPIVFHVSAIVEPSVWAFATACIFFLLLHKAEQSQEETWLILAGLVLGVGALMRQNVILLWPVFVVFLWAFRSFVRRWSLVLTPVLFLFPYLLTVAQIGHPVSSVRLLKTATVLVAAPLAAKPATPAVASTSVSSNRRGFPPLRNLLESIRTGMGPASIVKTVTLPWLIFLVVGGCWVLSISRSRLRFFYLTFFSGYALFFSIGSNLWGMGRYQAEFVAPCIALTFYLMALRLQTLRWTFAGLILYLGAGSLFMNQTIPQDVHFDYWARRRISTDFYFPYRDALGFVQRSSSNGKLVGFGGVPLESPIALWLRGFTFGDVARCHERSRSAENFASTGKTATEILAHLDQIDVDYFLVEYGSKREKEGRGKQQDIFSAQLGELMASGSAQPYALEKTFVGITEGTIDVYGRPSRKY